MEKLKKINLRRLNNASFFMFMRSIQQFVAAAGADDLKIDIEYAKFLTELNNLESQFDNEKGSFKTDALALLDAERDDAFCGIRDLVRAYLLHFEATKRQAAEKLWNDIQTHGTDVNRLSLNAETGVLIKMMNEWTTNAQYIAAVGELNIGLWVAHLKERNLSFESLYQERDSEMGNRQKEAMQLARAATMYAYDEMMTMFVAQHNVNRGEAPWAKVMRDFNGTIDKQNTLLSQSGSSNNVDTTVAPQ